LEDTLVAGSLAAYASTTPWLVGGVLTISARPVPSDAIAHDLKGDALHALRGAEGMLPSVLPRLNGGQPTRRQV
jgi:hypothetical protein